MNYTLTTNDLSPLVDIKLNKGESVKIAHHSMVYHNGLIKLEGNLNGKGILGAIGKSLVSGQSMFITSAIAQEDNAVVAIAPANIGHVVCLECGIQHWILNDGVFLACDSTVDYNMKRINGIGKALLGSTGGFYNMVTTGTGQILIDAFGGVEKREVDGDFICNNHHVLAWSDSLNYDLEMASGNFGFRTGEGFVLHFKGKGTIYIQTRSILGLVHSIEKYLPSK